MPRRPIPSTPCFPRIFRPFLKAAANVRRYLICARLPAVPPGWMIDHPGILTQTARLRQSSPIRLMTKARTKRAGLFPFRELGATDGQRERERRKGSTRCLYQFLRLRPCCRGNLCNKGSRRAEGGRGVISRLKPLLPAWHFGKGRNLGPPADRAARYYPGRGW